MTHTASLCPSRPFPFNLRTLLCTVLSLPLALAGCVADEDAIVEDASDSDLSNAKPVPITIQLDDPPYLVLYREGTHGAWRSARRLKDTTYEAKVRGPYTVMTVCSTGLEAFTSLTSQTLQDERLVEVECTYPEEPLVDVAVSMAQPGIISIGNGIALSQSPNWSWWVPVEAGTRDLTASDNNRLLLQRGLQISEGLTLPPIDLATATLMPSIPFHVPNPPAGETLSVSTFLSTPGVFQGRLYRGPLPARVAPNALLAAGELQAVSVRSSAITDSSFLLRTARRDNFRIGDSTETPMWNPLSSYQLQLDRDDDIQVTWTPAERFDALELYAFDAAGRFVDHVATASYVQATGVRKLTLETDVPGYLPQWRIDPAAYYDRTLFVRRAGAIHHGLQYSESVNLDAAAAPSIAGAAALPERVTELHRRARLRH